MNTQTDLAKAQRNAFVAHVQQHVCRRIVAKAVARRALRELDVEAAIDAITV